MVDIEVDDPNPISPELSTRIMAGDRGVGKQTEAHGPVVFSMMPGRAHLTEGVSGFACHHGIDSTQTGTDGTYFYLRDAPSSWVTVWRAAWRCRANRNRCRLR